MVVLIIILAMMAMLSREYCALFMEVMDGC